MAFRRRFPGTSSRQPAGALPRSNGSKGQQRASAICLLVDGPLRQLSGMAGSLSHPVRPASWYPGTIPRRGSFPCFADRSTGRRCTSRLATPADAQSGPVPLAKQSTTSAFSHAP